MSSDKPPMLRTSTKAAFPGLADIWMEAGAMVTMTYCSGLPTVWLTILDRDDSNRCRCSSESATLVSSFRRGIRVVSESAIQRVSEGRLPGDDFLVPPEETSFILWRVVGQPE